MTLNGVMAVTLRYFTEFVNLRCRIRSVAEFMQQSIVFLLRVQCRRKESSRSLSHLLMSFL